MDIVFHPSRVHCVHVQSLRVQSQLGALVVDTVRRVIVVHLRVGGGGVARLTGSVAEVAGFVHVYPQPIHRDLLQEVRYLNKRYIPPTIQFVLGKGVSSVNISHLPFNLY